MNKKSQTQVGYGYAVAPYNDRFTLQELGTLVEGMKLESAQKKEVLKSLTKFAVDGTAENMQKMKAATKEAEDFW